MQREEHVEVWYLQMFGCGLLIPHGKQRADYFEFADRGGYQHFRAFASRHLDRLDVIMSS